MLLLDWIGLDDKNTGIFSVFRAHLSGGVCVSCTTTCVTHLYQMYVHHLGIMKCGWVNLNE